MRFIAIPTYGERWLLDDETQEATLILGDYPHIQGKRAFRGVPYEHAIDTVRIARLNGRITIEQDA